MALHPDFPQSPHAILDPGIRWVPRLDGPRWTSGVPLLGTSSASRPARQPVRGQKCLRGERSSRQCSSRPPPPRPVMAPLSQPAPRKASHTARGTSRSGPPRHCLFQAVAHHPRRPPPNWGTRRCSGSCGDCPVPSSPGRRTGSKSSKRRRPFARDSMMCSCNRLEIEQSEQLGPDPSTAKGAPGMTTSNTTRSCRHSSSLPPTHRLTLHAC